MTRTDIVNKSVETSGGFQLSLLSIEEDMQNLLDTSRLRLSEKMREEERLRLVNSLSQLLFSSKGRKEVKGIKESEQEIPLVVVEE